MKFMLIYFLFFLSCSFNSINMQKENLTCYIETTCNSINGEEFSFTGIGKFKNPKKNESFEKGVGVWTKNKPLKYIFVNDTFEVSNRILKLVKFENSWFKKKRCIYFEVFIKS